MSEEIQDIRLANMEEFRREQLALNKTVADSLHRIELSLNSAISKACPLPGHCVKIEEAQRQKWEGDKLRFERAEARLSAVETFQQEWKAAFDAELKKISNLINRGLGALAILTVAAPVLTWFVITYLVNK